MRVSVVVPTLNEEDYLPSCLESLHAQSVGCEIIVVDSGSSDSTVELAGSLADKVLEGRRNIAFNRQLGLEAAAGDIVVSTDADCVHPPGWLESLTAHFSDEMVVAVSGPTLPLSDGSVFLDKTCYFIGNLSLWILHKLGVVWFRGSNTAYLKSAALEAGGYDTSLTAREDSDLSQRVSRHGVTIFDWGVRVMTSMRRRQKTGWFSALRYYVDTPVSLVRGKQYYRKA
jgi:glycosyltransferase involved in cell wall biosynthesis